MRISGRDKTNDGIDNIGSGKDSSIKYIYNIDCYFEETGLKNNLNRRR